MKAASPFVLLHKDIWRDPDFHELSSTAKITFVWTFSNPQAALSGLYHTSLRAIARDLGHDLTVVEATLDELANKPLVKYDPNQEVIWVVNRAEYASRSARAVAQMQREVYAMRLSLSPLVGEFVARYGKLLGIRDDR